MSVLRAHSRPLRSPGRDVDLVSVLHKLPASGDPALLAEVLAEFAAPDTTLVIGITGSVAAGKSTISRTIADNLRSTLKIEVVSTDGFLYPNDVLAARGLSLRKGYPETYDLGLLSGALQRARWGAVRVPGYSYTTHDRAPELDRTITRPDILLVEGLGFSLNANQRSSAALLDLLIYVDAQEADLETWFVNRFLDLRRTAETDSRSFYARFRHMSELEAETFAHQVWRGINLPNLRENIAPLREHADFLIAKAADHSIQLSMPALAYAN